MWRWLLLGLLVHWNTITSQPINEHEQKQPNECCPCPKDPVTYVSDQRFVPNLSEQRNTNDFANNEGNSDKDQDTLGDTSGVFPKAISSFVDDCPCRVRDADSMGSSSVFFPSTDRAVRPDVSSSDKNADVKPLLHPEVGLASSVLETLRQATDEEYEDALVRDAARSAMRANDDVESNINSASDTAKNVVAFIINPNDEQDGVIPEESRNHESRCIHPLGRSKIMVKEPILKPSNLLSEIYYAPKIKPLLHRNVLDMDSSVGASNVNEQIVTNAKEKNYPKLKSNPSLFNLFSDDADKNNADALKGNNNIITQPNTLTLFNNDVGKLKPHHILKQIIGPNKFNKDVTENINTDNQPISIAEQMSNSGIIDPKLKIKSLLPFPGLSFTTMKPFYLKNLLKLKDVELIPPVKTVNKEVQNAEDDIPQFSSVLEGKNRKDFKSSNLSRNELKLKDEQKYLDNYGDEKSHTNQFPNVQIIPNSNHDIKLTDAVSSPSETKVTWNEDNIKSEENCSKTMQYSNTIDTENTPQVIFSQNHLNEPVQSMKGTHILDALPSASESKVIVKNNKAPNINNFESQVTDSEESGVTNVLSNLSNEDINSSEITDLNNNDNDDVDNVKDMIEMQSNNKRQNKEDCLQTENMDNMLHNEDNTDSNLVVEPKETYDDEKGSVGSNEFDTEEGIDTLKSNPLSKIVNDLSSLKESISKTLEDIRKPKSDYSVTDESDNIKTADNNNNNDSKEYHTVKNDDDSESIELKDKSNEFIRIPQTTDDSSNNVSSQELQNMSDNLLDLSTRQDKETLASQILECDEDMPHSYIESTELEESVNGFPSNSNAKSILIKNIETTTEMPNRDITDITNVRSNELTKDEIQNSCSDSNIAINEGKNIEMVAEASDPVGNTIPADDSKSIHNIFRSNLRDSKLNIGDILNINLPSLKNLRGKSVISNIFDRPNNNVDTSTAEHSDDDDDSDDESSIMATQASTPFSKVLAPSLIPLEDINLDVFQLNPLLIGQQNIIPKLPRLNINSYKAKLPIPKTLGIAPLKLESSINNKNGIFGATLSMGPNTSLGRIGKDSTILGTTLNNLPTLEDLHETVKENAHNLLITPLEITSRNAFDDTLRSGQTISDNIRSHAKNTLRDIQQTFETTLKDVRNSDLANIGDSLSNPHEFLQAVSRTHEDVNDKLKAIHYDFNDRLESIRDRIIDPSLLPSLNLSPLSQGNKKHSQPAILRSYSERKPVRYTDARSEEELWKENPLLKKSNSINKTKFNSPKVTLPKSKSLKITASDIPKSKLSERSKLKASASEPSLINYPSIKSPQLSINKNSISNLLAEPISRFRDSKVPVLSKYKPKSKVKISFSPTTKSLQSPSRINKDFEISNSKLSATPKVLKEVNLPTSPRGSLRNSHRMPSITSKARSRFDSNGAASELTTSRLKPTSSTFNINKSSMEQNNSENDVRKDLKKTSKSNDLVGTPKYTLTNPLFKNRFTNDRLLKRPELKTPRQNADLIGNKNSKVISTAVLNKLPKTKKNHKLFTSRENDDSSSASNILDSVSERPDFIQPNSDMLKSASKNNDILQYQRAPLQENTSYTCRMMCTRNN
ncbi:MATH and LRR domain-containing protein PFE0570w-like [Achroia grisella]|uniref:MATH and LRR domain-containing protein PFE0570w-like n=1 Tax=Achroia grisella TaxID=688607 RepID=UPI0027D2EA0C|nr:MATH and LRR domain-containing protein PFE0570w-like [Achroia grisella]